MNFNQIHFAHPIWLWVGIAIPIVWIIYFFFSQNKLSSSHLEDLIDKHLLPYLLVGNQTKKTFYWQKVLFWSIAWACLTLALSGPSWSYREIEMSSKDQSLVILLDLSESMNTKDVKPSRLTLAKQKIEDLINFSQGVKIGLIAFAADPHMIAPITDDKETIRYLLPSLNTDLVYVQGSRLSSALDMASAMLEAEPGANKALLIVSDGDFEDSSAITSIKKLADQGVVIHTLGIGTSEGFFLQDHQGNLIKKNGSPVTSKLEKNKLLDIAHMGKGHYLEGSYSDQGELIILKDLEKRAQAMAKGKKVILFEEYFYLFVLPVIPLMLWWFRRGAILFLLFFMPTIQLEAMINSEYFLNSDQQGEQALNGENYEKASVLFKDPYRKGVAYYKAGNYVEAEKMFRQSFRLDVALDAEYNLGNSLVQQQKLKEAVLVYEEVLKKSPNHIKAKENLELVKKMIEEHNQESSSENSDQENQENDPKNESQNSNRSKDKNEKNSQDDANEEKKSEPSHSNENQKDQESEIEKQENNNENSDSLKPAEEQTNNHENSTQEQEQLQLNTQQEEKDIAAKDIAAKDRSQEDQEADFWLNRLSNDSKTFLKNKFYIESKQNGTIKGIDPW